MSAPVHTPDARRFHGLDGLRGVCALAIAFFHAADLFHKGPILQHAYLAVDMFFLLSGFVIALSWEDRLARGTGLADFLRARGRRLLPVFLLGAGVDLAIFLAMAQAGLYPGYGWALVWIIVPITTLLMLPAFTAPDGSYAPAMLNVTWSLLVEWLVNIAYAMGLFRLRCSALATLATGCWALMAVSGYYTQKGWCVGFIFFQLGVLRGAAGFLMGVVIFRLHTSGTFRRLPVMAPEILVMLWLAIAAVPALTATPTFDWVAVMLLSPPLMILLLRAEHRAPAWFGGLGALSYPLYVIHPGFILLAQKTPLFGLDRGPNPLRALAVEAVCIAAACAIAQWTARRRPALAAFQRATA